MNANKQIEIEKVSELEWYLTMESYHQTHHVIPCNTPMPETQRRMTLEEFRQFYNDIKEPVISEDGKHIEFYAPFEDRINILPGKEIQFPLGFAIRGNLRWLQPEGGCIEISSCTIDGESNGKGEILNIKNISNEIVHLDIKLDGPICTAKITSKEVNRTPSTQSDYFDKVNALLEEIFTIEDECYCSCRGGSCRVACRNFDFDEEMLKHLAKINC